MSKALLDNKISEDEFDIILKEWDINSIKKKIVEKKEDVPNIQKLREEVKEELLKQLISPKK